VLDTGGTSVISRRSTSIGSGLTATDPSSTAEASLQAILRIEITNSLKLA
jgi:hypothetical protein